MSELLFKIRDLNIYNKNGKALLENINFDISRTGIFAILGETGSGKTLLSRGLIGFMPQGISASGNIFFYDEQKEYKILDNGKFADTTPLRGKLFMWIPQACAGALNPRINCLGQITLPLQKICKLSKKEAAERAEEMLEILELGSNIKAMYPHEISGGMKVRLMLATATAMRTKTLILDELSKGLDENRCKKLMELIGKCRQEYKMQIGIITHQLNLAAEYANQVLVLHKGKMIDFGSTKEVLINNRKPYVEALWKALPENGMELVDYGSDRT